MFSILSFTKPLILSQIKVESSVSAPRIVSTESYALSRGLLPLTTYTVSSRVVRGNGFAIPDANYSRTVTVATGTSSFFAAHLCQLKTY